MILLLAIPIITAIACYLIRHPGLIGLISLAGACVLVSFSAPVIVRAIGEPVSAINGMLYMDALSGYIMALVLFLALASAIYSIGYL